LETARKFYEDMLGLTQVGAEDQELIVFRNGNSTINVYHSQYAGTNQATGVTWVVGENVEDVVGRSHIYYIHKNEILPFIYGCR
jgi:catechol 2,3-dioxygenase-like lactoylglutathione lyase family enzyme